MIKVEIITIGDELLIGQVVDTNSAWMAQALNSYGFDVCYKTTIGDDEQDIQDAFERACSRVSVVLVTGGIGPTKDDITKKTLCRFFDTQLIFEESVVDNINQLFKSNGFVLNELTRGQAYVPENCMVIQNRVGTAPITWFDKNDVVLVSMPGVPYEMKEVMTSDILPRLQARFETRESIQHRTFLVQNYTESRLAIHLEQFEDELPEDMKLAYLPSYGFIRLRITGKRLSKALLTEQMDEQCNRLTGLLGEHILAEMDQSPEFLLAEILSQKGLTLSVAESCTGGKIAHLITSIPGSSRYFKGGIVAYSNEIKQSVLDVSSIDLENHGAVSEPVVRQMAVGALRRFGTDCAIATSGIAGPDGGTEEKPIGTVWIAVAYKDEIISHKYSFSRSREGNIARASNSGILMLLELVKDA